MKVNKGLISPYRASGSFLESHATKFHHSDFTERISPAFQSLPHLLFGLLN